MAALDPYGDLTSTPARCGLVSHLYGSECSPVGDLRNPTLEGSERVGLTCAIFPSCTSGEEHMCTVMPVTVVEPQTGYDRSGQVHS